MRIVLRVAAMAAALSLMPAPASADELALPKGPGEQSATLIRPVPFAATVLIVPGKKATAEENEALAALAAALGDRGFGSVRIERAADLPAWSAATQRATGGECVWLLGHGKGGRAALAATGRTQNLCGVILVAAPAKAGKGALALSRSAGKGALPLLVVSAGRDPQAGFADGAAIRAANPGATHTMIIAMDGTLREEGAGSAVSPGLVDAVTAFLFENGPQIQETSYRKKAKSRGRRSAELASPFGRSRRARS